MSKRGPLIHASPARLAALEVGATVRSRRAFTNEILASSLEKKSLSPEDRAFATRLALGVTSSLGTLDEVIDRFLRSPQDVNPDVRDALRVSAYEILFLDKSAHAAVDQGVELVKSVTPKAGGLANAVLRKIAFAKKDFPFGDPETDLAALARLHAFPVWLAQRLIEDLGVDAALAFMKASNEPAPVFLAVNAIKADPAQVQTLLEKKGIALRKVSYPQFALEGCFRLNDARALQDDLIQELFNDGKLLVSDAASQVIATLVLPERYPDSYLEIGSGRGTKSILLQSNAFLRYGKQMKLIVLDSHEFKMRLHKDRMKKYGVNVERSLVADAKNLEQEIQADSFDAAFIDAPCSGLGTLRRHPEIRWKLDPCAITAMAQEGLAMLEETSRHIKPGGMLSYATCTVLKEENTEVIRAFLTSDAGKDYTILPLGGHEAFSTSLSPGSSDAHFAVRMVRRS